MLIHHPSLRLQTTANCYHLGMSTTTHSGSPTSECSTPRFRDDHSNDLSSGEFVVSRQTTRDPYSVTMTHWVCYHWCIQTVVTTALRKGTATTQCWTSRDASHSSCAGHDIDWCHAYTKMRNLAVFALETVVLQLWMVSMYTR